MLNKEIRYEISQKGLRQLEEDNKRAADVKKLYEVMSAGLTTIFIIFLV
ncbi:MAG: hypothetical protein Q8933_09340 [Bacteroidota bacterium]|nr:hypothetical protein [Bacteroidota bacterium]